MRSRRPALGLTASAACGLAALIALSVFTVPAAWRGDTVALDGFTMIQGRTAMRVETVLVHSVDPVPFAIACLCVVIVALWRRRTAVGIAAGIALVGAAVTSQAIKALLPAHTSVFSADVTTFKSFPSGHTTAAMSLALGAMLVCAPRWRRIVAGLGGAYALGVSFSLLLRGAHYPSDVLGGVLVALSWSVLACRWTRDQEVNAAGAVAASEAADRTLQMAASWIVSAAVGGSAVAVLLGPTGIPAGAVILAGAAIGLTTAASVFLLATLLVAAQAEPAVGVASVYDTAAEPAPEPARSAS
jgi:membrane-associated phospholipid phosphatase